MSNNNDSASDQFKQYLPDENNLDKDKLSIEIPAEQHPTQYDRVPSGYEPMGEIQLRGRIFSGLAAGQTHWWVLISGWFIFGFITALLLHAAIATLKLTAWMLLAVSIIPLFVLLKGTIAKLAADRRRL